MTTEQKERRFKFSHYALWMLVAHFDNEGTEVKLYRKLHHAVTRFQGFGEVYFEKATVKLNNTEIETIKRAIKPMLQISYGSISDREVWQSIEDTITQ